MKLVEVSEIPLVCVEEIPKNLQQIYETCKEMHSVCDEEDGAGLSAVQVGIPWSLFVIRNWEGDKPKYRNFLNCSYEGIGEKKFESVEGCLSLRDSKNSLRFFKVLRYNGVRVTGEEIFEMNNILEKRPVDFVIEANFFTYVFQHEIDHHFGILISQIGEQLL